MSLIVRPHSLSHDDIVQLGLRAQAQALQREMEKYPQLELPLFHHFLPGLYIRELHVPADALTVGKIHKYPCLNFLSKGERTTLIGDVMTRIKAPFCYWSPPGNQRVSYTHEDSVWITQHWNPRNERDVSVLESELVADSEEDYQQFLSFLSMEVETCPS